MSTFIGSKNLHSLIASNRSFKPRLALAVFSTILFAQALLVICTPKSIAWDPSYGLLAAQQKLVGRSPSIFTLVEADPTDITRLSARPVPFFAPGYQGIPYVLRLGIFDWNTAINLTLGLVLIAGAIGWYAYFAHILGSAGLALWLASLVALTRFRWTMPLVYDGGDQLIWGLSPWVLLLAAAALQRAQQGLTARAALFSGIAGASGASLFALKYNGVFIAIGAGVAFFLICLRERYWQLILPAALSFLAIITIIIWAGFPQEANPASTVISGIQLEGNPIASLSSPTNIWRALPAAGNIWRTLATFGVPATGVTDLDQPIRYILHELPHLTTPFIGLGLSLFILAGIGAFGISHAGPLIRGNRTLAHLAIGAVIADLLIMSLLIFLGAGVGSDGRYGRVSGLLLLPMLVGIWHVMLLDRRWIWRAFAATCALILLVLPSVLATARQLPKLSGHWNDPRAIDGIVNQHLTPGVDAQSFYAEVRSLASDSVLYTIYTQMAFPLPRRPLILVEAEESETPQTLSRRQYRGRPPGGVALLLPVTFEHNGKLTAIQASFMDMRSFVRHRLPDQKWALWVGVD